MITNMQPPETLVGHDGAVLAQILLSQGAMSTQLAVIDTKTDQVLAGQADHELRIRALERFRYLVGGASLLGGALTGLIGYALGHVK